MIDYKHKHILKKKRKNLVILKYQLKKYIIKSIIHNRTIPFKQKGYLSVFLSFNCVKNIKQVCLISGQFKSVNKTLMISRFQINYLAKCNKLIR
jgi:hypothetical protein